MVRPSRLLALLPNRRRVFLWVGIFVPVALAIYIVVRLLAFAQLFGKLGPHAGIAITQQQVVDAHTNPETREPVIPQIIHQIFHDWRDPSNKKLPDDWAELRQSCMDKNPGWEVKIWYAEESHAFIANDFPWFLSTYEGYKYPIQRVDVMRYFLVRKFGGIYIDLDNGCETSLEALRYFPAFTTDGGHGALSNNIIGAQPDHPWTRMLTDNLDAYNWNWLLPYARIMYNSGQWFLTAMWERYHASLKPDGSVLGYKGHGWKPIHRVMMDGRPGADPWVFFNNKGHGGTWGAGDDWLWRWLGLHWMEVVVEVIVGIIVLITSCVCCVRCARRRRMRNMVSKGYQRVAAGDIGEEDVEMLSRVDGEDDRRRTNGSAHVD